MPSNITGGAETDVSQAGQGGRGRIQHAQTNVCLRLVGETIIGQAGWLRRQVRYGGGSGKASTRERGKQSLHTDIQTSNSK